MADRTFHADDSVTAFREAAHWWRSLVGGIDDHQWEHRRQLAWQGRPDGDGWQPVGAGWFPWAYFARRLGEPALVSPEGYDPFES